MLNVHLGAPGLVPDLLQTLAATDAVRAIKETHVIPRKDYQDFFSEFIMAKNPFEFASPDRLQEVAEFTELVSSRRTVVISQSNFFGYPVDALRPRKSFPLAEARVERLSRLLGTRHMTLHLTITSQVDYILRMRRVPEAERLKAIRETRFSWAELVFRLRRGAGDRTVVVWDFDRPKAIALPFVETMLDIEAFELSGRILKAISSEAVPVGSGPIDYSDTGLAAAVARLDSRYELDLDEIERMDGVTLIRHESVPEEFHL